ncbi:hypothetical protein DSECCO2_124570 [anaerobic digester metagenome]
MRDHESHAKHFKEAKGIEKCYRSLYFNLNPLKLFKYTLNGSMYWLLYYKHDMELRMYLISSLFLKIRFEWAYLLRMETQVTGP